MTKAEELASAFIREHLDADRKVRDVSALQAALVNLIEAAHGPALQNLPEHAQPGTAVDWDPQWLVPPGWHMEVYPAPEQEHAGLGESIGRATNRHDRMHAAARLIKD